MSDPAIKLLSDDGTPLDMVEEILWPHDWKFNRVSELELTAEVPASWCTYKLSFMWQEEFKTLQFSCELDLKIPDEQLIEAALVLMSVNERMWVGHFGLTPECSVLYRHTILLYGPHNPAKSDEIEDIIDIAMAEAERFYPVFRMIACDDKSAEVALSSAILDPVGEA